MNMLEVILSPIPTIDMLEVTYLLIMWIPYSHRCLSPIPFRIMLEVMSITYPYYKYVRSNCPFPIPTINMLELMPIPYPLYEYVRSNDSNPSTS